MTGPRRLHAIAIAVLLATGLLLLGRQLTPSGWYSAAPAYRAQVDALLDGHLALSPAPEAVFHDLAWTDSGVHQVWGLGVPAWQAPFELAGRAVGWTPFPDRIPLLVWLALAFYVVIRAFWRRGEGPWWVGAGAIVLTALLPPVVTLIRGRVGIYEEAALYAYGAALILLGTALREPSRWRLLALCAFAGLVGFIRPTAACYGVASVAVASVRWLQLRGRRGLVEVALGGALFVAGGGALYASNAARFGDGLEFGHRLNLQSLPGNLYATRFSYPMQRASVPEAALELVTSLFDRPELRARGSFYQKHLHHGVSKRPRWREYYFTTYTWAYLPVLLAGFVLGALAWRRRGPAASDDDARTLVLWATLAVLPLLAFYLRAPFMSSRYQIDLAPAFAALLVVAWRAVARWRPHVAVPVVLAAAWVALVGLARTAEPRSADPVGRDAAVRSMLPITLASRAPRTFPPAYDLADPLLPSYTDIVQTFDRCAGTRCVHGERATPDSEQWVLTEKVDGAVTATTRPPPALYLNLYRWDLDTGRMPPASFAFVDDPQLVEVEVSTAEGAPITDWEQNVRVAVGLVHLRLVSATPSARGTTLRFEASGLHRGLQVIYFAFGPDDELAANWSRVAVHRIRWR